MMTVPSVTQAGKLFGFRHNQIVASCRVNLMLHRIPAIFLLKIMLVVAVLTIIPVPATGHETGVDNALHRLQQQDEKSVEVLEQGKPIEQQLRGGEEHSFQLKVDSGQYLNVVVEQRGVDVVLTLSSPDGKPMMEVDSPNGAQGPEPLTAVIETAGVYMLNIRSLEKDAPAGSYQVKVVALHPATEQERKQFEVFTSLAEAKRLEQKLNELRAKGKYDEAIAMADRVLAIREMNLAPDHKDVAKTLNDLASLYNAKGDNKRAESRYLRALAIDEKAFGPESINVALIHNNLAVMYRGNGDYLRAESSFQKALAIIEKRLGLVHPDVSTVLGNFALMYQDKGDNARAEPLFERALTIDEKAFGRDHPNTATPINNLALNYLAKSDYARAEELFKRALSIREKALGSQHPVVATSIHNLAGLYLEKGDYAQAAPLQRRALAIYEKVLGPAHPLMASALNSLAAITLWGQRDFAKAEEMYVRALAIREKALGAEHPEVASVLTNLAEVYSAKGNPAQAITSQTRANEIREHHLNLILATGSERQKQVYMETLSAETNLSILLQAHYAPNDPAALRLAVTTILQRKGRVLDAMSDSIGTLRRRLNPQDRALLEQLSEARAGLAALVLKGPGRTSVAEHKTAIARLESEAERLEAAISARSGEFRAQSQLVTLARVQAAIPKRAALVEVTLYRATNPNATRGAERFGEAHYMAYVLRHEGEPQWVELGPAGPINLDVARLRDALRDVRNSQVKPLARALDQKIMRPVRKLLGRTRTVLLSPDGTLNVIPFGALVDEQGHYLVERYSFSYLTSGRDLLRLEVQNLGKQGPLVFANPSFDKTLEINAQSVAANESDTARRSYEFTQARFKSLPGTAMEANAISTILRDVRVFSASDATETAIKQVSGPRILHVATHGFFLADQMLSGTATVQDRSLNATSMSTLMTSQEKSIENPLLRSGLAFAGANDREGGGGEDGVLTALEAAGLDLWGTKLVVLSACETGIGEIRNGEGVYGLRRALVLAGAESQVMTLWQVSDMATRDLIVAYYKQLRAGQGRGQALRTVQLDMLRSKQRNHPFYWASFIHSGAWTSIDETKR